MAFKRKVERTVLLKKPSLNDDLARTEIFQRFAKTQITLIVQTYTVGFRGIKCESDSRN
jgi:hypothetical protein